ncbi:MAG: hypothetical protein P8P48_05515 [Saprospiraceae bacterium]|nr:hypothetical protein [Saprospiraceae bacterium]
MKNKLNLLLILGLFTACETNTICRDDYRLSAIYPKFHFCKDTLRDVKYDTLTWNLDECQCFERLKEKEKQYNTLKETYEQKNNTLLTDAHRSKPATFECKSL